LNVLHSKSPERSLGQAAGYIPVDAGVEKGRAAGKVMLEVVLVFYTCRRDSISRRSCSTQAGRAYRKFAPPDGE